MRDEAGRWLTYNGEVYNYPELRAELGGSWRIRHRHRGRDARPRPLGRRGARPPARHVRLRHLGREPSRSCSARATASASSRSTTPRSATSSTSPPRPRRCCRSCPPSRPTSRGSRTTWPSSSASPARPSSRACASSCPATSCACAAASPRPTRYWEVYYDLDFDHTAKYFEERIESLLAESVKLHLRSDVPVAAYLSGGLDSSTVASLASRSSSEPMKAFTGRFPEDARYDESALRARPRRLARPRPARGRHRRRRLPRHDRARSSTTWTTRRRARARSRSTWSRRRRAAKPRSSSAARAATRSSAATRAT